MSETPFEPFTLHMANGRKFLIDHPEIAIFSIDQRSMAVAMPDGGFSIIDLRLATHAESVPKKSRTRKR